MLIELLVKTVSRGGNLIMNVGPTARGFFDVRASKSLGVYADWMRVNSRSIYGCTKAEPQFTAPEGILLTQSMDEKRLYIHLLSYSHAHLAIQGLSAENVAYMQFLYDGSEIMARQVEHHDATGKSQGITYEMTVPGIAFQMMCPVIEVFLK